MIQNWNDGKRAHLNLKSYKKQHPLKLNKMDAVFYKINKIKH